MEKNLNEKEKNFEFIKDFSKISVTQICKNLEINRQNIFSNKASSDKIKEVKNEIDKQVKNVYKNYKKRV